MSTPRMLAQLAAALCTVAMTAVPAGPVDAAQLSDRLADDLVVTIDPTASSVVLGANLDLTVTVTNTGANPTPALVVHLDITDPDLTTSVDPEDWTPTLSKQVGAIEPGGTIRVEWNIQPISGGTFSTYAVVLSAGVESVASSNVLEVQVADRRSLNPGGILPVAFGAPGVIGALLIVQIHFARRTRGTTAESAPPRVSP